MIMSSSRQFASGFSPRHSVIISSFNTGSHVISSRFRNICGMKIANPRAYHMGSNIEGGDNDRMGTKVLHFDGVNDENQRIQTERFNTSGNGK